MGKTKKGSRFAGKSHEDDNYEKLLAFAEKSGKQIWELSFNQLEDNKSSEEEIYESEEELDINNKFCSIDNNELENWSEKITPNPNHNHSDNLDKQSNEGIHNDENLIKLELNNEIQDLEDKFPIILKIGKDITKKIDRYVMQNEEDNSEMTTKIVKFENKRVIYEYPREEKSNIVKNSNIKKSSKLQEDEVIVEKKDKKKKSKDIDEINDEELERLKEARRRREEFAYLEKLEEEEKKQKMLETKLENNDKIKDKNKFKPKPKKKKGK